MRFASAVAARSNLAFVAIVAVFCLGASACAENPVGRVCFLQTDGSPSTTVVGSPALDCQSRTCLHFYGQQLGDEDLCTGDCNSDGDCEQDPVSPCESGFTCGVPVVVGPFCCRKMCICKDYLPGSGANRDGGLEFPAACEPSDPKNECCNLEGRRDNPAMYPACGS